MLSKSRKIPRKLFPHAKYSRMLWNGKFLRIVAYPPLSGGNHARFAVVVAKKKFNTHAARNLFKRRVFAVIHKQIESFDRSQQGFFVIFPLSPVESATYAGIFADIETFLKQQK